MAGYAANLQEHVLASQQRPTGGLSLATGLNAPAHILAREGRQPTFVLAHDERVLIDVPDTFVLGSRLGRGHLSFYAPPDLRAHGKAVTYCSTYGGYCDLTRSMTVVFKGRDNQLHAARDMRWALPQDVIEHPCS